MSSYILLMYFIFEFFNRNFIKNCLNEKILLFSSNAFTAKKTLSLVKLRFNYLLNWPTHDLPQITITSALPSFLFQWQTFMGSVPADYPWKYYLNRTRRIDRPRYLHKINWRSSRHLKLKAWRDGLHSTLTFPSLFLSANVSFSFAPHYSPAISSFVIYSILIEN